ncbi:MAG TPA: NAD-dependent dehydratase [Bacteroidales bacterium]|nr:MAG: NAD-dependent dehydratase [Bacteroidetes bacterium GWE2_42_24]OFY26547.1 MAG: NAD-dependent dehydratase [Bacteroidetes bacterium GWF2_43_11]PKP27996.1 MAG: NAD-dependent dehydratase [Bacteroidetes bacterium HGW-Bacteroidetes-22]HBZ67424.1 NAD-dependent dehydratase [Bacteroidales bacterium]
MQKVLLAGATGYLGSYILKELINQGYQTRVIVRNPDRIKESRHDLVEIFNAEITQPGSIVNCCNNVDTVISTVGITRQKDGLTYMDVDFQANLNILKEAQKSGVKKFIYISVLNGDKLTQLKICEAKEKFVSSLKQSGIDYCIIRPNGFFSDMSEFLKMAQNGRIYLFGDGRLKANPIHGSDLAKVCVDSVKLNEKEVNVGGPQTLSQFELAEIAFKVANKKTRITFIPIWIARFIIKIVKTFTGSKTYGPLEFFMTVLTIDMIAPEYGERTIEEFYRGLLK